MCCVRRYPPTCVVVALLSHTHLACLKIGGVKVSQMLDDVLLWAG